MEREHEAHSVLQDVASLMGAHSVAREEDAIRDVLMKKKSVDEVLRNPEEVTGGDDFDAFFENLASDEPAKNDVPTETQIGLYATDLEYLDEALREAFVTPEASLSNNGVAWTIHKEHSIAELEPPRDLQQRLAYLPQSYLADRAVTKKMKLATTAISGKLELERARAAQPTAGEKTTTWPEAHFLGPLHPVLEWASDRALASLSRREVLAVRGNVENATVLLMGTLMNQRGQVVSKAFFTADFPNPNNPSFCLVDTLDDLGAYLKAAGLTAKAINPGAIANVVQLQQLVPVAVENTSETLEATFAAAQQAAERRLASWQDRADHWQESSLEQHLPGMSKFALKKQRERIQEEQRIAASLAPSQRLVRPLLVITPENNAVEGAH